MATIKLSIFDDFLYFLGFSCFHPRGSGAGAPDMGHVIHQNDHLVNLYHIQEKKLEKIIFVTLWNEREGLNIQRIIFWANQNSIESFWIYFAYLNRFKQPMKLSRG